MTDSRFTPGSSEEEQPIKIDTSVAHPARVWDYWLGGKDNYLPDREVGDHLSAVTPEVVIWARADREFLGRVVRYLAGEVGIRQFLDIGTGIPTANNTHEVAQAVAPECHIVYVDNDPIVLAHARALLVSTPEGATDYVNADLHEPDRILQAAAQTLDFSQPIAIMLLGILEFIATDEAYAIVNRLLEAVPSGSYLAVSCATNEINAGAAEEAQQRWNESGATPVTLRNREELARFFDRLELLEPGVVSLPQWRPDRDTRYADREIEFFGAVGRKH